MLPSRPTLKGWNPDALATSADAVGAAAESVEGSVKGIGSACGRMPETRAWEGRSHESASAMFGRANGDATKLSEYAHAVASALRTGSSAIGGARSYFCVRPRPLTQGR
ncbi:WXG100 family type VII secretion target [Mycolicibacterium baixiangningiae]|uniref:WXG100 family type VII secretion target n=1 Tax=Mycolicibacterium baixiangningiae TaxID=2761578 RepID=UPI00384E6856